MGVFAQERTMSQAEFDAVIKNGKWALSEWKGKAIRMTQTSEVRREGKDQEAALGKTVIEFASPTTSHLVSEIRSESKITKSEQIRIGDKTYKRQGEGAWIEGTTEAKPAPKTTETAASSPSANKQAERQIEYKYLGTERLNNQTASVYATIWRTKRIVEATKSEALSTTTKKYWFSEDGVKLKEDTVSETQGVDVTLYNRLTVVWELDPNIKVEAPVLN
jgi:hypothetical protein